MSTLERKRRLGDGAYSVVHLATNKEGEEVAVKCNIKDAQTTMLGSQRELDHLQRFKGHPFIVDLKQVVLGDPFSRKNPLSPCRVTEGERKMEHDGMHFVMECIPMTGNIFFANKTICTPSVAKILASQLLTVFEFIHKKDVTHRDPKPPNLLIAKDVAGQYYLKVSDFGMARFMIPGEPVSPNAYTSWYRAPEVCSNAPYTSAADIFSVGLIIYEMFAPGPWLAGVEDNCNAAYNAILSKSPSHPDSKLVEKYASYGRVVADGRLCPLRRQSWKEQLRLSPAQVAAFNQVPGTLDQLDDLLTGLTELDPAKRLTASQALEHPFFDFTRSYIAEIRRMYPPVPRSLSYITIVNCFERRAMAALAWGIYNARYQLPWYRPRILFQAISLYNRYLAWAFSKGNTKVQLEATETTERGRLHDRVQTELGFWVCVYASHKYFVTLTYPIPWSALVPEVYQGPTMERLAAQLEITINNDAVNWELYQDTLYEAVQWFPQHQLTEAHVDKLLMGYLAVTEWSETSIRGLYRHICGL